MKHVVLLGDSVFDNGAYVGQDPDLRAQLQHVLPTGHQLTLLAQDGAVIGDIGAQLRRLPSDATHVVISAGGNDALLASSVLDADASSVADALQKLGMIGREFRQAYAAMLAQAGERSLPLAVCTIYEPRFPEPARRRAAGTALTILNDAITREAFARGLTLIDLRVICDQDDDLSNAIEPSAHGGAKIVQAIAKFVGGAAPASSVFHCR